MIYTDMTRKALSVSMAAHARQLDKGGSPYIYHPIYVAEQMDDELCTIVALLHDVAEDTDVGLKELESMGFPAEAIEALRLLCHKKDIPYFDYIRSLSKNPVARTVKLADLQHNSDLSRLKNVSRADLERVEKYRKAAELLQEEL